MPFGLRNAPSVCRRCIDGALKSLEDGPLAYIDDVLCCSSDVADGLHRLDGVLRVLSEAGFSFSLRGCRFMKARMECLGCAIESGTVGPNSL